ncbi:MAG: hypothetical protein QOF02_2184 [Blastocatellia bacterium]|jgi:YVTN family beta-propeller protein|nr:hypothetical protein [Blastocatellia bacterium]
MRRNKTLLSALILLLGVAAIVPAQSRVAARNDAPDQPGEEENLNRELWEYFKKTPYKAAVRYSVKAQQASRAASSTDILLPNGWRLAPAGAQVEVGRFPYEAVAYAGHVVVLNTGYYRDEPQEVSVVNTESGRVVKTLRLNSLFPSAQVGVDGDLYISGGYDRKVYRVNQFFEIVRDYSVGGYAAGLAAIDGQHIAVAYMVAKNSQGIYDQGKLAILNTASGEIEHEVALGYYPHTVRYANGKLYVTLLGENKLQIFDLKQGFNKLLLSFNKSLPVGRTPQDICIDGERLYVVNTGSDDLTVIDGKTDAVASTISLHDEASRFGSAPTSCAVEGNRLYVTQTYTNSVVVLDKGSGKQLGLIPTGWYPAKVLLNKSQLLVLNAKGIQPRRPNFNGPQPLPERSGPQYVLTLLKGSLSIIPRDKVESSLPAWTRQAQDGSPLFSPRRGFKLPIRHVFYIIRENRSYDQVMGDLGRGNGDPFLTLFGREITPNGHRLADEFVTLDNYYANGEISVLGHSFTTSGYASPFLEWIGNAAYSGRYAAYPFGTVPAVTSPAYLWDALDAKKVDYRIYGENYFLYTRAYRIITETFGAESELAKKFYAQTMTLADKTDRGNDFYTLAKDYYGQAATPEDALRLLESKPEFAIALSKFLTGDQSLSDALAGNATLRSKFAEYLSRYPFNYRSWDLRHSDLERAKVWKEDFESQLRSHRVAQLHYIWLPNDHTNGVVKGYYLPDQLVAQNDAALGRIIETIAKSEVWKESIIFVTEDDAQNGPDHVDATRTVALAVGPYIKRGAVINDRYDQLSMLRTIELLLGLDPLNMNDTLAVPMFGIFTEQPDVQPYLTRKPSSHLIEADRKLYEQFEAAKPPK